MIRRRFEGAVLLVVAFAACTGSGSSEGVGGNTTSSTGNNGNEGHCFQDATLMAQCAKDPTHPEGWICQDVAELTSHGADCLPGPDMTEYCCTFNDAGAGGDAGGDAGG